MSVAAVRFFVDSADLAVYFDSAAWVAGAGRLYRNVWSFYPLPANLFFGLARWIAQPFGGSLEAFTAAWAAVMAAVYCWAVSLAVRDPKREGWLGLLLWLAPAPLYFALWRFDVLPAVATFLALFAIRDDRLERGALWLGVALAFKGYALFLLPTYCVYVLQRRGLRAAVQAGALGLLPFVLSLVIVFGFAGYHGVRMPFLYHLNRGLDGGSTWDAMAALVGVRLPENLWGYAGLTKYLQLAFALGAAAMRPRTFEALVHALLFALVGFMTASLFQSPQWILWIVPLAYFSSRRVIGWLGVAYGWSAYLYFPVICDLTELQSVIRDASIVTLSGLRFALLTFSARAPARIAYTK